ncbi:LRR receptor-like serine/threonine-protein kinase erl1 [Phtheirospermum japonicum]|uniref:LRR receptor-like serine/threonine-protein kinase erl1 n=1 Tax=Phtheirospermum japonicum TaxID=374723 RepID=A0A830CFG8_9LAMI|nr:LRR receptor-like serine/threonine-protein kinase erl1 [Phtheirospermum japonicum]
MEVTGFDVYKIDRHMKEGNLSNLNLGGEISPAIGDLRNLESVDLSDNLLEGDKPFSISKLKQLEQLNLKNELIGPIPSTLAQTPNLKTLGLRGNMLTGTLSPGLCQLSGLWGNNPNRNDTREHW